MEKQIKQLKIKERVEALKKKSVDHQQKQESIEGICLKDLECSGIKNDVNEIK